MTTETIETPETVMDMQAAEDSSRTDAELLAGRMRSPQGYQRLQAAVRAMSPMFSGFITRRESEESGPAVLAAYVSLPETLDADGQEALAVALCEFAVRFRPDLGEGAEAVAEVCKGIRPAALVLRFVSDGSKARLTDMGGAEIVSGSLRDVLAVLPAQAS